MGDVVKREFSQDTYGLDGALLYNEAVEDVDEVYGFVGCPGWFRDWRTGFPFAEKLVAEQDDVAALLFGYEAWGIEQMQDFYRKYHDRNGWADRAGRWLAEDLYRWVEEKFVEEDGDWEKLGKLGVPPPNGTYEEDVVDAVELLYDVCQEEDLPIAPRIALGGISTGAWYAATMPAHRLKPGHIDNFEIGARFPVNLYYPDRVDEPPQLDPHTFPIYSVDDDLATPEDNTLALFADWPDHKLQEIGGSHSALLAEDQRKSRSMVRGFIRSLENAFSWQLLPFKNVPTTKTDKRKAYDFITEKMDLHVRQVA